MCISFSINAMNRNQFYLLIPPTIISSVSFFFYIAHPEEEQNNSVRKSSGWIEKESLTNKLIFIPRSLSNVSLVNISFFFNLTSIDV
jgi:hypothetical protein